MDALQAAEVGIAETYSKFDPVRIHLGAIVNNLGQAYTHILDLQAIASKETVVEKERFWRFTPDGEMEEIPKEAYAMEEAHDVYELN